MYRIIILLISLILSVQCFSQTEFTTCLFDISRNRVIPIAVYQPKKVNSKTKVIIFSHGYDGNKRGTDNILFTIQEFKNLKPQLNWSELILMGHSNGGDMTMLFATKYPQLISKAISMDHRRMIMPRTLKPRLYTLRGCDYEADAGVLPTGQEQEQFRMKVVKLDGVTHSNMGENGTAEQHDLINQHICKFLTER